MATINAAEVVQRLQTTSGAAIEKLSDFDPQQITKWLESVLPAEQLAPGAIALLVTMLSARNWAKDASRDGRVTTDERLGIISKTAMMAAGVFMIEGAMVQDFGTAVSALGLVAAETKLVYDIIGAVRSGELNPMKQKVFSREYGLRWLKVGVEFVGATVVVPKLGALLFVGNFMVASEAAAGGALVLIANHDVAARLMSGGNRS